MCLTKICISLGPHCPNITHLIGNQHLYFLNGMVILLMHAQVALSLYCVHICHYLVLPLACPQFISAYKNKVHITKIDRLRFSVIPQSNFYSYINHFIKDKMRLHQYERTAILGTFYLSIYDIPLSLICCIKVALDMIKMLPRKNSLMKLCPGLGDCKLSTCVIMNHIILSKVY